MEIIAIEEVLPFPVEAVWAIITDITRSDWVPSVDAITVQDGVRSFTMAGVGAVKEKILRNDEATYCLQYSAIETPSKLDHHLATIKLTPMGSECGFSWTSEIAPENFAPAIAHGMQISLQGLQQVLANTQK